MFNSIALPRQQWLRERASVLRYTYVACLIVTILTEEKLCNTGEICPTCETHMTYFVDNILSF